MFRKRIADHQWQKLYAFLQGHSRAYAGREQECRRFVEAVHWILRAGAQWRELPDRYGKWNSVFKRYSRWEENGVWADMFKQFAQDPEMAAVMPDSTVVRAHMSAAGGSKKGALSQNSASARAGADSAARSISNSRPTGPTPSANSAHPLNPLNHSSDNHASLQRVPQKGCLSLPHPIKLHALWVCDAGGLLPKAPVQQEMTLNSSTHVPGQMTNLLPTVR